MNEKTKIGLSVSVFAALLCFLGMIGSYTPVLLAVGYVLLCEENEYLKKTATKVLGIMVCFSVVIEVIGYIPDAISIINGAFLLFNHMFSVAFLSHLVSLITIILTVVESVMFLVMGIGAWKGKDVNVTSGFDSITKPARPVPPASHAKIVEHPAAQETSATRICPYCGAEVEESSLFCFKCGKKL